MARVSDRLEWRVLELACQETLPLASLLSFHSSPTPNLDSLPLRFSPRGSFPPILYSPGPCCRLYDLERKSDSWVARRGILSHQTSASNISLSTSATGIKPVTNAPMLSASASQSHFSFNRNGDAARQSSSSYDFLPSVSFDDLHASIESASSDFKLAQFPSPTGAGSILDSKGQTSAKSAENMTSTQSAAASNRAYIPSTTTATTTRPVRSSSIIRRPSTSSRQPSTSSIASSWSASGEGLTAPAPVRSRRQSQYPPVSSVTAPAKPPRKSMGPGILVDSDTYSSTQRRRPSIISDRGGSDSTRTSMDGSDSTRPFNTSRASKTKSVQPPPRVAQPGGLSAYGVESNRLSLAARSPRLNANNRGGLSAASAANKRASMMPGTGHSAHASGLGARTISPTDTRRMKRMSMMPPPPQPMNHHGSMPPPPVSMDNRATSRSPSLNPAKSSLTPSSARTTPDHSRKSYISGLSVGSNGNFPFAQQPLTGSTQSRSQAPASNSRLPAPKNNINAQNSSDQNEDDEDVPPVPAIPKVYESPKDNAPAGPYFLDKKRSALGSVETLSIHSNSTGSISLPPPPELTKPRRRPSARKSAITTSSKDEKQPSQSRRHLQPLTLPPLNLAPLSIPTAAKVAALQDQPAKEPRSSPPPTRHVPKTPTTPMTASKSSFFQNRYDDTMELPVLRSSSTVHHSHRKNTSPPDAGSSDSSSIIIQEPSHKYSISPYLSSSLPRGGFDFGGHKRSKASVDYATVSGDLTGARTFEKPATRSSDTAKYTPKSPRPAPTPDEPPTPSSMSSLRRKLSLSWKRSASKNHGDSHDAADKSSNEAVPRLPTSATVNNLYSNSTNARSPTTTAPPNTTNEPRTQKSSTQGLAMLPHSKSESWGNRKESDEYSHMKPISRIVHSTHKSLKPKGSSTTLRQTGAYSANELDKDDLAANDEMRKMGSRRKETDIAARTLDALKRRASPKERVGPQEAIRIAMLNIYERGEIIDYGDVYFCGTQSARKVVGDLQSDAPNFGYDDDRGDYTIIAGDHLAYRYEIVDILGKGSFGQVLRCIDHKLGKLVAIKIIRNKKRFHQQALVEVNILQKLREWDPQDKHSMVSFTQSFYFRGHLCISTELLDMNLYEFIKAHSFRGFSLRIIRRFTKQILSSLILLKQRKIIHCDLKPENILLKHPLHSELKVIDFGSSCFENEKVYTYIQSRFYRSPEVILGMTYGLPIDMWSVGCILAELFTGVPIFPGENEQEQLACIMEVFGPPEKHLIEKSTRKKLFFDSMGKPRLTVSSKGRRRRPSSKTLQQALKCDDEAFIDFLTRCLRWDPDRRLKPEDAVHHEFITGQKMPPAPRMPTRESSPVKRNNTITVSRPLPDPPKNLGMLRTVPSPVKGAVALNAVSRRASGATGATAASISRRTSAGPGSVTSSSSGLPRIAGRSASGKSDLAAAGASAAMNRRA
ncbi:kinase-like domain [Cordyceps militaris]|uniref:Kinase-like domain n=1 Tax=Cordyceps militaris TaxID=73501 RepID=A0A2H4STG5_CORMI|nr:kinase-like domain [Cordyceps militaris]